VNATSAGVLFLDRDGVINEKAPEGQYIRSLAQLRLIEGVAESIGRLRQEVPGLRIAIVSNQRGIARGLLTRADVELIDRKLLSELASAGGFVDRIEICPHEAGSCDCRKPATGMLERVLRAWPERSAVASAMVGDSSSDIVAGARIGARTYLVGEASRRSTQAAIAAAAGHAPDVQARSLPELVRDGALARWLRDGFAI
jgi:D-glycero-D-manno-heptose 1,7-bisphosphate phosphatase